MGDADRNVGKVKFSWQSSDSDVSRIGTQPQPNCESPRDVMHKNGASQIGTQQNGILQSSTEKAGTYDRLADEYKRKGDECTEFSRIYARQSACFRRGLVPLELRGELPLTRNLETSEAQIPQQNGPLDVLAEGYERKAAEFSRSGRVFTEHSRSLRRGNMPKDLSPLIRKEEFLPLGGPVSDISLARQHAAEMRAARATMRRNQDVPASLLREDEEVDYGTDGEEAGMEKVREKNAHPRDKMETFLRERKKLERQQERKRAAQRQEDGNSTRTATSNRALHNTECDDEVKDFVGNTTQGLDVVDYRRPDLRLSDPRNAPRVLTPWEEALEARKEAVEALAPVLGPLPYEHEVTHYLKLRRTGQPWDIAVKNIVSWRIVEVTSKRHEHEAKACEYRLRAAGLQYQISTVDPALWHPESLHAVWINGYIQLQFYQIRDEIQRLQWLEAEKVHEVSKLEETVEKLHRRLRGHLGAERERREVAAIEREGGASRSSREVYGVEPSLYEEMMRTGFTRSRRGGRNQWLERSGEERPS